MFSEQIRGLYAIVVLCQAAIATTLFWALVQVVNLFYASDIISYLDKYILYNVSVVVGMLLEGITASGSSRSLLPLRLLDAHHRTVRQIGFIGGSLLVFLVASKDQTISRLFLGGFVFALYVVLTITHLLIARFIAKVMLQSRYALATIILGSPSRIATMQSWLDLKALFGLNVLGWVTLNNAQEADTGYRCLGGLEELEHIIKRESAKQVLALEIPSTKETLQKLISSCEGSGARLVAVSDLEERFGHSVTHFEDEGIHFLCLRNEPLENPLNRVLKRGLDIAVSLPVVVVILPVMTAMVWLVQKIYSPGPVFYTQARAGIRNQPFQILKYRTMHVHNEDVAKQATAQDNRVYPLGRFLRKYSLDELPQFINALRGEMSVVGPRPHLLEHNERFSKMMENYHVRSLVKPGITGLAQIRGFRGELKSEHDIKQRVEADIQYLEGWSIGLDLIIILKTCFHVIRPPRTAY